MNGSIVMSIVEQLNNAGFSVVPGFLNRSEISSELVEHLATATKFSDGVIKDIPPNLMALIHERIAAPVTKIASEMGLLIDEKRFGYCAIRIDEARGVPELKLPFDIHRDPKIAPGGVLNWHLDHFSYFLYQDHKNWLICYLPVVKASSEFSNLAIIPDNVLKRLDPRTHARVTGRGAMRFRVVEGDTAEWFKKRFPNEEIHVGDWWAIDDFNDKTMGWKLSIDLEQEKIVPELRTGDLLIMRADVIHRTNDANQSRISVRCDALPKGSQWVTSLLGLIFLTLQLPIMGRKRRYNLKKWVSWEWKRRLYFSS